MPYFKNEDGKKGHTNSEEVMARLEEAGFIRLKGKELLLRIFVKVMAEWGIPAVAALIAYHFTGEFALAIFSLYTAQQILN